MNQEYDSAAVRHPALEEFVEIWHYRDLLQLMVLNSIKTRYKRSALGVVWTLLSPLLNTIVLSVVFSFFFSRFTIENYPIYILSGLLMWNFFSQSTNHAMNTLVWGSDLLKRIYVPRSLFAISVVGNGLVNLLLGLIPLALIMLAMGQPFSPTLVILPLAILLLVMFTLGFALLMSALAIFFVDVVDLFGVVLSAWFYFTPVIYPLEIVPEQFAPILKLNPVYYLLDLFRQAIFWGEWPGASTIVIAVLVSVTTLAAGWLVFTKRADDFAYHI